LPGFFFFVVVSLSKFRRTSFRTLIRGSASLPYVRWRAYEADDGDFDINARYYYSRSFLK
jgi:hypothetical protein